MERTFLKGVEPHAIIRKERYKLLKLYDKHGGLVQMKKDWDAVKPFNAIQKIPVSILSSLSLSLPLSLSLLCLSICLSHSLSTVCLSVYLSLILSLSLSLCLSICLSHSLSGICLSIYLSFSLYCLCLPLSLSVYGR